MEPKQTGTKPKSKTTAYLLWFFLGGVGAHKFYLNRPGLGVLYLFTAGLLRIGWIIDAFALGTVVDEHNAIAAGADEEELAEKRARRKRRVGVKLKERPGLLIHRTEKSRLNRVLP